VKPPRPAQHRPPLPISKVRFGQHRRHASGTQDPPVHQCQQCHPARPGKMVFRFWQEGPAYDRNLQTQAAVLAAIDYIHLNP
jgi:hypothetical protein